MSEPKKLRAVLFGLGITPLSAAGGLYLGAFVLTRWLDLKSAPALAMLPRYWEYSDRLPQNFRFPLYAASGLTAVVAVAPLFIILAVLFANRKYRPPCKRMQNLLPKHLPNPNPYSI